MRMCMGCRARKRKDELIRFVRSPEGNVFVKDRVGVDGRGFYLCPDPQCLKKVQKRNRAVFSVEV